LTMVASSTTMNWATQTITSVSQGLKWRFSDGALTAAEEGEEPDPAGTAGADAGEATTVTFLRRGLGGPLRLAQADRIVRIGVVAGQQET
jgi:hypothetical protein